jgi:magnesium chelatase subunit H
MRVAIITLDGHLASTVERVNRDLQASNVSVTLHSAGDWARDADKLTQCHEAIAKANIVVVTMLFMEEHINAVLEPLRARRDQCDAIVCCMCAGDIVKLTRMGNFTMDGGDSRAKAFFQRLRKSRSRKKSAGSGKLQMAMLRRIPQILRYIPGTAQDIRNYFLVLQYWLAGSHHNALNLVQMLVNEYADGSRLTMRGSFQVDQPQDYVDIGLYHPALARDVNGKVSDGANGALQDGLQDNVNGSTQKGRAHSSGITDQLGDLLAQSKNPTASVAKSRSQTKGRIGLLLMRSYVLAGNTRHYDAVIAELEALGYEVIPAFASGLDARPAIERFFIEDGKATIDALLSLTGFSLVGGPAYNDASAAESMLTSLDVPYLAAMGIEFQTLESWNDSARGLLPIESAMMVALPELDGATHPTLFGGRSDAADRNGSDMYPHQERITSLCRRIDKLAVLRKTPRAERRLAIVIFNFPPNAGATGTAAHLSVFDSLYNTLQTMQAEGYTVELPASADELRCAIIEGNAADYGADANVTAVIPVDDHVTREPHLEEIEKCWGPAPGKQLSNGQGILVCGKQFGNVLVSVQPGFGYEGDPMRLLFEHSFAPTHAFSAFYRYLREDFGAHAALHFGTHGALEFMPGKQTGLSGECWPDRLIGDLPNYYLYAANNASEGTIAKRRAAATLISYQTPPVTHAGLYRGLLDLKSTIDRWRTTAPEEQGTRQELFDLILSQVRELDLDVDDCVDASLRTNQGEGSVLAPQDADKLIESYRSALLELESTLIPHGLHVVGRTTDRAQRVELLQAVAQVEASVGELPEQVAADAVEQVIDLGAQQNVAALHKHNSPQSNALLDTLHRLNVSLQTESELPAIVHALDGGYIKPVVGGDLLRSPDILPTGRNLHGFDPYRMPSASALRSGQLAANNLIERHLAEGNRFPETIAMVLWGTDNLKTEGSPIAQVLSLIGAEPRFDNYGRLAGARLTDLETLGRPRIDVIVTLSGIFRDLLPQQTRLLAEAAWLAATAEDEPLHLNFVRQHALDYMHEHQCDMETAALRVFSNADGAYGSNVNHIIDEGSWSDENELADVFARRKSFAYGRNGDNVQQTELFEKILSRVELASQNLDSVEIGVTTIDHYFDTLGGISRCVQRASESNTAPAVYISDDTIGKATVRTLSEQVELETRTRVLNPKWYEQMLEHGYEGVRHIEAHVTNTVGWSATTGQVKPWVYQQLTNTFMLDEKMRNRLADMNPEASMRVMNRLHEAHERNYWQPDAETLAALQSAGEDLEDRLEGITEGAPA